jgi:hypothetical protein
MDIQPELTNSSWETELRKIMGLARCQFPAETQIRIGGTLKKATIAMTPKGLGDNMQSDAAAFEAWALALLVQCGAERVEIFFDDMNSTVDGPHYQRFLYRLRQFKELFPARIVVGEATPTFPSEPNCFLNQPESRKVLREDERAERLRVITSGNLATTSENALEKALEVSSAFKTAFKLDKVMRQWPAGLFRGRVQKRIDNILFPGTKSAIDLIGLRGDTLVLFELKRGDNRKAGAISELLFYVGIMRDALRGNFRFERMSPIKNCAISPAEIVGCKRLTAVLVAPISGFHPLILHTRFLTVLNEALAAEWPEWPVHFEMAAISWEDARQDFAFAPITQ